MRDIGRLPALGRIMEEGVRQRVFPGGVLQVLLGSRTIHLSAHGRTSTVPLARAVGVLTCFDLASLTKVLATTPLIVDGIQRKKFDLDRPVCAWLENFRGDRVRERVTLRNLLEHSSGLPAWRPYFEEIASARGGAGMATRKGQQGIRELAGREPLERKPGERALYSDVGFILLDWILQLETRHPTDSLFLRRIAHRLGCTRLFYVDLKSRRKTAMARKGRTFAATERCPWRGRILMGEVHDDNCYAMGGVSGHAGLFGAAQDVARVAQAWLDGFHGRPGILDPGLVRHFWKRSGVPGSTRAVGFDTPSRIGSQAGSRMGKRTVGHTGFTGTSLWIDPDRELVVVLLTNRVHPDRDHDAIRRFRPALHDRVVELVSRTTARGGRG